MILDIETDGLLDACTTVHCAVLREDGLNARTLYRPAEIGKLLKDLDAQPQLVGHNIQGFDLLVLKKLYGYEYKGRVVDTLVMSRLIWPDIASTDFNRKDFPKQLIGRHSLEAWGYRVGLLKGEFAKTTDWQSFSEEMLEYCQRDTDITAALLQHIVNKGWAEQSCALEHAFAKCIDDMMQTGFAFAQADATQLAAKLMRERADIDAQLVSIFPPFVDKYTTPKKKIERSKLTAFNPQSRGHIARALREKYGWQPKEFTDTGEPKLDESILSVLPYSEAPMLLRRLTIQKRLGQLAEGTQNWMAQVKADGRIHGFVNHNGAVTGRCTHSNPNMAQVPKEPEYRGLFVAGQGKVLVGCDAAALELRCFAHYLARYDAGAYAKEVLSGDIHTANQKAAGLPTRAQAKTFIYALLYGAGDEKMGEIVGGGAKEGKTIRAKFMRAIPAYADLLADIKAAVKKRGYLLGMDGRRLAIRSEHAALNTLLQSAGAVLMKQATVLACAKLQGRASMVAHVHDEMQFECRSELAEEVKAVLPKCIEEAGTLLAFRIPMAGEARVGRTWAETH